MKKNIIVAIIGLLTADVALAGGGNAAALPALLAKAEEGRRQLEARVQSGTILQDPVQEALPVVQWR